jgi:hypothetical protein
MIKSRQSLPLSPLSAIDYRAARAQAFSAWTEIAATQIAA